MRIAEDRWLHIDGGFSHQYRHAVYKSAAGNSDLAYDCYSGRFSPRYVNECDIGDFGNKFTAGFDFRYDRFEEDHFSYAVPVERHFFRHRLADAASCLR